MRRLFSLALLTACGAVIQGSTLQHLSLDDMIVKSTAIVRGRPQQTYSEFRGSIIYTHYQVQVSQALKGAAAKQLDIAVPGGMSNGMVQAVAGAPALVNGRDYVMFLWTSKSGLTQIIGLSQGLFVVNVNASGQAILSRAAATERMLNAGGQPITDSDMQMPLSDLQTRIQSVLGGGQ